MNKYNFLWIDDEWEAQEGFRDEAAQLGVKIIPRKTSREGMKYLEESLNEVDAVILDAKVFDESEDETASLTGLMSSLRDISTISGKANNREIPHAIYTGQPDLQDDLTFKNFVKGIRIFSKAGEASESEDLIEYLKDAAKSSTEATIRNRYSAVYAACMDGQYGRYGKRIWNHLLIPFRSIENSTHVSDAPYSNIRKALEDVMWLLMDKGYLPKEVSADGRNPLSLASLFFDRGLLTLKKEELTIISSDNILPEILKQNLRFLTEVTAPGSHSERLDEVDQVDEVRRSIQRVSVRVKDHHLVEICTLLICDLIVYLNSFLTEKSNSQENDRKNYSSVDTEVYDVLCKVIKVGKDKKGKELVIAVPEKDIAGIGLTRFSIYIPKWSPERKEGDSVYASSKTIIKDKGSFFRKGYLPRRE